MVETTIATGFPKESAPNPGLKKVLYKTAACDAADTLPAITLANIGIVKLVGVNGYSHSTTDSIVVPEAPTTAVSSGDLTITVGGAASGKIKYYEIIGL